MKNNQKNIIYLLLSTALFAVLVVLGSPFLAIAFIAGLIILYFSFKNPLNSLLFLAAYLPFEPWLLKFVPTEIYSFVRLAPEILILAMLLLLIFQYITGIKKFKYKKNPVDIIIILFLIIWLVSTLFNQVEFFVSFLSLRQILRYVLVFYLILYATNLKKDQTFIKKFLSVAFAVLIFQSLLGLSQLILPASFSSFLTPDSSQVAFGAASVDTGAVGWNFAQRISGTFGRYDKLGIFLSFFLLLAVGLKYKFKKLKTINVVFLFGILALIFTFSRLSWLGFLLGLIWIGVFIVRDKKLFRIIISAVLALIIYLVIFVLATGFNISRYEETPASLSLPKRILQSFSTYELQNSYYGYGRIFFWVNTPLKVVSSSPLVGVGPGMYGSGVAASLDQHAVYYRLDLPFGVQDRYGQIDNNWLSLWGEYGSLGLLIWLGLFVVLYRQTKQIYLKSNDKLIKGLSLGFLGIIIVYGLQSFFGPYFEVRTISFYFWAVAGIMISFKS